MQETYCHRTKDMASIEGGVCRQWVIGSNAKHHPTGYKNMISSPVPLPTSVVDSWSNTVAVDFGCSEAESPSFRLSPKNCDTLAAVWGPGEHGLQDICSLVKHSQGHLQEVQAQSADLNVFLHFVQCCGIDSHATNYFLSGRYRWEFTCRKISFGFYCGKQTCSFN